MRIKNKNKSHYLIAGLFVLLSIFGISLFASAANEGRMCFFGKCISAWPVASKDMSDPDGDGVKTFEDECPTASDEGNKGEEYAGCPVRLPGLTIFPLDGSSGTTAQRLMTFQISGVTKNYRYMVEDERDGYDVNLIRPPVGLFKCECDTNPNEYIQCNQWWNKDIVSDNAYECWDQYRIVTGTRQTDTGWENVYAPRYARVSKIQNYEIVNEGAEHYKLCTDNYWVDKPQKITSDLTKYTTKVTGELVPTTNGLIQQHRAQGLYCTMKLVSAYGKEYSTYYSRGFIEVPRPGITSFTASAGDQAGTDLTVYKLKHEPVTLSWDLSGMTEVHINESYSESPALSWGQMTEVEGQTKSGKLILTDIPYGSHTFTLFGKNSLFPNVTAEVKVNVIDPPMKVIFGHQQVLTGKRGINFGWSVIGAHKIRLQCASTWGSICDKDRYPDRQGDDKHGYEDTNVDGGLLAGERFYAADPLQTHVKFQAWDRFGKEYDPRYEYQIGESSGDVLMCQGKNFGLKFATDFTGCIQTKEAKQAGLAGLAWCGVYGGIGSIVDHTQGGNEACTIDPKFIRDFEITAGVSNSPLIGKSTLPANQQGTMLPLPAIQQGSYLPNTNIPTSDQKAGLTPLSRAEVDQKLTNPFPTFPFAPVQLNGGGKISTPIAADADWRKISPASSVPTNGGGKVTEAAKGTSGGGTVSPGSQILFPAVEKPEKDYTGLKNTNPANIPEIKIPQDIATKINTAPVTTPGDEWYRDLQGAVGVTEFGSTREITSVVYTPSGRVYVSGYDGVNLTNRLYVPIPLKDGTIFLAPIPKPLQ